MSTKCTRREFLVGVSAAATITAIGSFAGAATRPSIVAVEWGGHYVNNMKAISSKQTAVDVQWELHAGGAAAILAKIRAAWPKVPYDVVAAFTPVFSAMIHEDWLVTVTPSDIPSIADIPERFFIRDAKGNRKAIPRTLSATFWGYRKDICPFPIRRMEDLLDPRLKGKVLIRNVTMGSGSQISVFARAFGGDEHNMQPGWDFMKKLAKSGNVGRIASTDNDLFNSITTGETCVALCASSVWKRIGDNFPIVPLTKQPTESGLTTILAMEGWGILRGGNTKATTEWLNFMLPPNNVEAFNKAVGAIPANKKAKVGDELQHVRFTEEEFEKYTAIPDWDYLINQLPANTKRWETEIAPLF